MDALLRRSNVPLRNVSFNRYPGTPPSQCARIGGVGAASSAMVGLESYLTTVGLCVGDPTLEVHACYFYCEVALVEYVSA